MSAAAPAAAADFREIALLRLSSLGDVVLTLPVVHALARAYPNAKLHYWVKEEFADVVRHDPAVAHVRILEKDARRIEDLVSMSAEMEGYDLIVDLHGSARSRILTARQAARLLRVRGERMLRARWVHARWSGPPKVPHALERYARTLAPLGVKPEGVPRMVVPTAAEAWAEEWLREKFGGTQVIGFCPAAHHFTKRWPEEHWLELLDLASPEGLGVVAFSLKKEKESLAALAKRIDAGPRTAWSVEPLARQAALLGRMAAVVTGDTGLMHVAAARGTRVVAMFGSTSPVLGFSPAGEGHVVLCRNEPCQPCTLHGRETCPKRHFRCMRELKPAEVFAALEGVLAAARS